MREGKISKTDLNRSALLAKLGIVTNASRSDLARMLNLSPALITNLTRDLIADGLVVETSLQPSSGGRPATLLSLAQSNKKCVGIKLVADHLTFVEMSIDGRVTDTRTVAFNSLSSSSMDQLAYETSSFLSQLTSEVIGIGVAVPGNVRDVERGVVDSVTLGWSSLPIGETLSRALGLPVIVENNVNAVATAEQLYGTGAAYQDFIVVTLGTGVGLTIISDGAILRGARGAAGELGHTAVNPSGPSCDCGKQGCLEALIGQGALERQAVEKGLLSELGTISDLASLANSGVAEARDIFQVAGGYLGTSVSHLLNLLDPEGVVLLGEGVQHWSHWESAFFEALRKGSLSGVLSVPVTVENWTDESWAQGAASLILSSSLTGANPRVGQQAGIWRRLASQ